MPAFAALLRAVNVGGTGKLPMRDLVTMCAHAGFSSPRTYIASGNVVFWSDAGEDDVKAKLEDILEAYAGKPVAVLVRTADELSAVRANNPFPDASPNKVMVLFLMKHPARTMSMASPASKTRRCVWASARSMFTIPTAWDGRN